MPSALGIGPEGARPSLFLRQRYPALPRKQSRAALATVGSSNDAKRQKARFTHADEPLSRSQRGGGRASNMSAIRV
eukprot:7125291-Pyramimonas_sp.AAC.1